MYSQGSFFGFWFSLPMSQVSHDWGLLEAQVSFWAHSQLVGYNEIISRIKITVLVL